MNAICSSKKLTAVLSVLLAIFVMVSVMTIPAFAEESVSSTDSAAATENVTEDATQAATQEDTVAESNANTAAADTAAATSAATTAAPSSKVVNRTRGIVNLVVGGVILAALVVLAIVFRAKIPVWFKSVKSECGKIVWCPKDKLRKNSFVVVIIILVLTVLIGLLDLAFSEGILLLGRIF